MKSGAIEHGSTLQAELVVWQGVEARFADGSNKVSWRCVTGGVMPFGILAHS